MRIFARVLLFLYVPIVVLAVLAGFFDPPWERHQYGTGYEGIVAVLSAIIAGLPWSLLFMVMDQQLDFTELFGAQEDAAVVIICWAFAGLNIWLLSRWAFPSRGVQDELQTSARVWSGLGPWVFDILFIAAMFFAIGLIGPFSSGAIALGAVLTVYCALRFR